MSFVWCSACHDANLVFEGEREEQSYGSGCTEGKWKNVVPLVGVIMQGLEGKLWKELEYAGKINP